MGNKYDDRKEELWLKFGDLYSHEILFQLCFNVKNIQRKALILPDLPQKWYLPFSLWKNLHFLFHFSWLQQDEIKYNLHTSDLADWAYEIVSPLIIAVKQRCVADGFVQNKGQIERLSHMSEILDWFIVLCIKREFGPIPENFAPCISPSSLCSKKGN